MTSAFRVDRPFHNLFWIVCCTGAPCSRPRWDGLLLISLADSPSLFFLRCLSFCWVG